MEENDLKLITNLDDIFKTDPGYRLSVDFVTKTIRKAKREEEIRRLSMDFLTYLTTFFIVLAVLAGVVLYMRFDQQMIGLLKKNFYTICSILVIVFFIFFTDKIIMPFFLQRNKFETS